jgi:hypothetical protein
MVMVRIRVRFPGFEVRVQSEREKGEGLRMSCWVRDRVTG